MNYIQINQLNLSRLREPMYTCNTYEMYSFDIYVENSNTNKYNLAALYSKYCIYIRYLAHKQPAI